MRRWVAAIVLVTALTPAQAGEPQGKAEPNCGVAFDTVDLPGFFQGTSRHSWSSRVSGSPVGTDTLRRFARRFLRHGGAARTEPTPVAPAHEETYAWANEVLKLLVSGPYPHPAYAWGSLHGARHGKALGMSRVSLLEFGVAGGRGLLALEAIGGKLERLLDIGVEVYGFDTGRGLPKPVDYRDLPNLYAEQDFPMDLRKLLSRMSTARLILGNIGETLARHLASGPAPVAFVSVDVDLYSSTVEVLKLFDASEDLLLPRVHCYFDDIVGYTYSEFNGERLAISEFNACHATRKIAPIYGLRHFVGSSFREQPWVEMMYLAHIFGHRLYNSDDGLSRRRTANLAVTDLRLRDTLHASGT